MRQKENRVLVAAALLTAGLLTLSACSVIEGTVEGTVEGMTAPKTSQPSQQKSPKTTETKDITVTVRVKSDAQTSGELSVQLDTTSRDQSLRKASVQLPFERVFSVATDTPFPLHNTRVEVDASPGATYIACSIVIDDQLVASHHAEGSEATATCDHDLLMGPL